VEGQHPDRDQDRHGGADNCGTLLAADRRLARGRGTAFLV
jgi:hypothetical protein